MPGAVLRSEDTDTSRTDVVPVLMALTFWEETDEM